MFIHLFLKHTVLYFIEKKKLKFIDLFSTRQTPALETARDFFFVLMKNKIILVFFNLFKLNQVNAAFQEMD